MGNGVTRDSSFISFKRSEFFKFSNTVFRYIVIIGGLAASCLTGWILLKVSVAGNTKSIGKLEAFDGEIDKKVDVLDDRTDLLESRADGADQKCDKLDQMFTRIDDKLDTIQQEQARHIGYHEGGSP